MGIPEQPHVQGGEVTLVTGNEADRFLSLRAAANVPLPPEIAMMDGLEAKQFHRWLEFYDLMGVSDHPLVKMLSKHRIEAAMAEAISHAPYLERVTHLNSWVSGDIVKIHDLAGKKESGGGSMLP